MPIPVIIPTEPSIDNLANAANNHMTDNEQLKDSVSISSSSSVLRGSDSIALADVQAVANENEKYYQRCAIAIAVLFGAGVLSMAIIQRYYDQSSSHVLRYVAISLVDLVLIAGTYRLITNRQSEAIPIIENLAQDGSLDSACTLVDSLNIEDPAVRKAVICALNKVLPNLHRVPDAELDTNRLATICEVLDKDIGGLQKTGDSTSSSNVSERNAPISGEVQLRCSMLKALEHFGNKSCLASVRRLAEINAKTPAELLIKDSALRCLPTLAMVSLREAERAADALDQSNKEPAKDTKMDAQIPTEQAEVAPTDTKSLLISDMERMD